MKRSLSFEMNWIWIAVTLILVFLVITQYQNNQKSKQIWGAIDNAKLQRYFIEERINARTKLQRQLIEERINTRYAVFSVAVEDRFTYLTAEIEKLKEGSEMLRLPDLTYPDDDYTELCE